MKKFAYLFFTFAILSLLTSQTKAHPADTASFRTDTLKVQDMHCGQCESRINRALKKVAGVSDIYADVETGTAVVTYDPATITRTQIEGIIVKTGYGIGSIPGDPAARKALPACCK